MATFQLDIVTPERTAYSGAVEHLQAPGSEGSFGVLRGHAPLLAALDIGGLSLREEGQTSERRIACSGGFVEVLGERVTVLAETAEFGEEIDLDRAQASRQRATERLLDQRDAIDVARAEAALARALNRIDIAGAG